MAAQQRICIGPTVTNTTDSPLTILLPNPSSGLPSRYVIQDGRLYEMQLIDAEGLRSWFIGDAIQADGGLYLITPIDPVFMFIPILDVMRGTTGGESDGRFLVLDDIFESDQYTSLRHLTSLHSVEQYLAQVCQVRNGSLKTFRLDDAQVMLWLKNKVAKMVANFGSVVALAESISYTESLPEACRTEAITQSSLKLVSAYLSDIWASKLGAEYQFPELEKLESRTQLPAFADFGKRSGMDMDEDPKASKENKKPKLSVGQRKLAKASTKGMAPMTSFFAKKAT